MNQQPEIVTLDEAALMLRVDYETVRRWAAKGVFARVIRIGPGRLIRLYRCDVTAQMVEVRTA